MKVWIDLAHPPHPLLFGPVARRLDELGHEVVVTARDAAQTLELARERWPDVEPIGGRSPKGRRAKANAIAGRARALRRWARHTRPDVALSHNSYAQIVAARSLGVRVVTAMDYEHQPANHVAFRLAHTILLPAVLPYDAVRRQGATTRKIARYDGLKEELYVGEFEPDREILRKLGVVRANGTVVVVMRAPSFHTLYHRFDNPIFGPVLERLAVREDVRSIVLAREPEQRDALASLRLPNVVLPERAVDSRSLMYAADLVVGAGGTMTREAAIMGIPTVSLFAGKPPFVDRWLEERGLLRRVNGAGDLGVVERREREPHAPGRLRERGRQLTETFVETTLETARR